MAIEDVKHNCCIGNDDPSMDDFATSMAMLNRGHIIPSSITIDEKSFNAIINSYIVEWISPTEVKIFTGYGQILIKK
ncbi:MAG: hypothetical protein ACXWQO_19675 [Bdellovibrionota bacterium]